MQGSLVLMSTVNHPPNCSTQWFLKVMIACKNVSTAIAASSGMLSCEAALFPSEHMEVLSNCSLQPSHRLMH